MSVHIIYYKDGAKWMRPVLSRPEYLVLRNSGDQIANVAAIRGGDETRKQRLVQMNYSCLPNDDGSLRGSTRMSTTVGMDIDHIAPEEMLPLRQRILAKKEELGLLMLELSARGQGYHLVFKRRTELSQEENLRWASELLGVEFDKGAKDITRVFFTTTGSEEDLFFLEDEIFKDPPPALPCREGVVTNAGHAQGGHTSQPAAHNADTQSNVSNAGHAQGNVVENDGAHNADAQSNDTTPSLQGRVRGGSFKGIPYSLIIQEFWRRTGGEPEEGERNDKLHKLAANLRAICDDSEEWLLELMPRYGLSEQEMRAIIYSACKEPTKGSRMMTQIVNALMRRTEEVDFLDIDDSNSDVTAPSLTGRAGGESAKVFRTLPIGLKESLSGVPERMQMPVLCSVLPIAAAYADQVEVEYSDGFRQHLGLMSIIRGEQASGKSVCKAAVDVWKRRFDEEDALARKREEEWKERKKGRKANEKAPDDPHVLIRMVPVTISCSTLLKRFKNAPRHTLYSFGEELDTLRKTNGAGSWSSKYDIYRLSFDRGEWGQDYNSDQAESGVVPVAYNWTILGTNGAMAKCFKSDNIENGLSSRILVSEMPDSSFQRMPRFGRRTAEEEERIQEAVSRLRSYSGFIDTPRLRKAIAEWVEQKRVEAAKDIDRVKDTYRRRAAVIGFRCGVVHFLLTQESGKASTKNDRIREPKSTIDFALMMAEYCLQQQIATFGDTLLSQFTEAREECQRYGANHSIYDQLPPTFTLEDLRTLKRGLCGESALRKIISRWYKDQWIEKADRYHWRKCPTPDHHGGEKADAQECGHCDM